MQTEQTSFHVKKGDEVVVIAGSQKGKRGKIIEVVRGKQRAIVEREGTIHISNLMKAEKFDARAAKRGVTPAEPAKA